MSTWILEPGHPWPGSCFRCCHAHAQAQAATKFFDVKRLIHPAAITALAVFALPPLLLANEPYIPTSDDEVLETLPTAVFTRRDSIRRLRERLAAEPDNQQVAATIAQHYVGLGKSEGDPRFYGYARAAVGAWWDQPSPSAPILRVRAKLKETDHDFPAALVDLDRLLQKEPSDQQAWVEVANIRRVVGDYDLASEACDHLGGADESIPALAARVPLMAVTGEAEAAYLLLGEQRPRVEKQLPGLVPWLLTMRAEIARALGRPAAAEKHYQAAYEADPSSSYLRRAYADFLLDGDRPDEVTDLLGDDRRDNGLLLRAAVAAKRCGAPNTMELSDTLRNRFAETRLRGDLPHGRYEARFELEFGDDPRRALELALANWARQKELRDSRNALEAALAAAEPAAAEPVIAFLRKYGTQDVAYGRLIERLEGE
ncbi:hypothetical protein MalM25_03680 [Planctomycetes bacterium MalM25]|nr:hypothetical protein MalM25_03680 [Planctomycetes bacterium MalM25]